MLQHQKTPAATPAADEIRRVRSQVRDAAHRAFSAGARTRLAQEFVQDCQDDLLAIVEELRQLRRSRQERDNGEPHGGSDALPVRGFEARRGATGKGEPLTRIRILQIRLAVLRSLVVPPSWLVWRLERSRARLQTVLDNARASGCDGGGER